ncbi:DUF885 family protein [Candidatus Kaiserbacteria bacterium]|nr:DUF885 family protein [Candidatus Kaiserbacteria bacterium]
MIKPSEGWWDNKFQKENFDERGRVVEDKVVPSRPLDSQKAEQKLYTDPTNVTAVEVRNAAKETQVELKFRAEETESHLRMLIEKLSGAGMLGKRERQAVLDDIEAYVAFARDSGDDRRYAYVQMSLAPILHSLQAIEARGEPSGELLAELARRAYDQLYSKLREAAGGMFNVEFDEHMFEGARDQRNPVSIFIDPEHVVLMERAGLTQDDIDTLRNAAGFLRKHQSSSRQASASPEAAQKFLNVFNKTECWGKIKETAIVVDKFFVHELHKQIIELYTAHPPWKSGIYNYIPEVIIDKWKKKADDQYQAGFKRSYSRLRPTLQTVLDDIRGRLAKSGVEEKETERSLEEKAERFTNLLMDAFPALSATTEYRFLPRSNLLPRDVAFEGDYSAAMFDTIARESEGLLRELNRRIPTTDSHAVKLDLLKNFTQLVSIEFGERKVHLCNPSFYIAGSKWTLIFLLERMDQGMKDAGDAEAALKTASSALVALRKNVSHIEPNTRAHHTQVATELADLLRDHIEPKIVNQFDSPRIRSLLNDIANGLTEAQATVRSVKEDVTYDRRNVFEDILRSGLGIQESPDVIKARHVAVYQDALSNFQRFSKEAGTILEAGNIPADKIDDEIRVIYENFIDRLATVEFPFSLNKSLSIKHVPPYLQSSWPVAAYHQGSIYIDSKQTLDKPLMKLLLAHEGVPGHALHENLLTSQSGPIERHLENPLSYEGWAVFCEKLITELAGADVSAEERAAESAIFNRYLALRAARGLIDLAVNYFDTDPYEIIDAFPWQENRPTLEAVIAEVSVNPGEYIPYIIGYDAVDALYKQYAQNVGPAEFFKVALGNGQPSWSAIAKLLDNRSRA